MERLDNYFSYNLDTMDQELYIIEWLDNHKKEYTDDIYDELIGITAKIVDNLKDEFLEAAFYKELENIEDLIINQRILLRDALLWIKQRDLEYNKKYLDSLNKKMKISIDYGNDYQPSFVNPLNEFAEVTFKMYQRIISWGKEEDKTINFFEGIILKSSELSLKDKTHKLS